MADWKTNVDLIQKLYIAFYGRPADPGGLRYWASQLPDNAAANSDAVRSLVARFIDSDEARARFGTPGLESVIDRIFTFAYGRDATSADKAKYTGKTVVDVLIDVISVPFGPDYAALNNKLQYAKWFTEIIDPNGNGLPDDAPGAKFAVTYSGNTDAEKAKSLLMGITAGNPPVSKDAVLRDITDPNKGVADPGDQVIVSPPATGQVFILTTGLDYADSTSSLRNNGLLPSDFKFTSANETVEGPPGTLTGIDSLIDPSTADNDVLKANVIAGFAVTPILQNIETIYLTIGTAGSGLDLTDVVGTKSISVTGAFDGTISAIDGTKAPTITLKDYNKTFTAILKTAAGTTAAGNAESLKIGLEGTGSKAKVILDVRNTVPDITSGTLEALSIESSGTAKNSLELALDATAGTSNITALTKTTITGAADLDLKVAHGLINGQELDASGMTGKFSLTVDRNGAGTATTNLTNVKGYQTLTVIDSTPGGDSLLLTGVQTGSTVVIPNAFAIADASITVKGAAARTNDVLTLVIQPTKAGTDIDVNGARDFTIEDVETLVIKSEGGTTTGHSIQRLVTSAGASVKIDGATKLSLGLKSAVSSVEITGSGKHALSFAAPTTYTDKHLTVDASGAGNETTIDLTNFRGAATPTIEKATVIGSAYKDTITGPFTGNEQIIVDAGAGNDIVKVYTANAGNPRVTLGAGSDELIIDDVNGNKAVIISDFQLGSGGDKLSVNTAAAMAFGGIKAGSRLTLNAEKQKLWILDTAVANDDAFKGNNAATDVFAALAATFTANDGTKEEAAVIAVNNSSGVAELWYFIDADDGADVDGGEVVKLAVFENITTVGVLTDPVSGFIAANFGTWL